MKYRRLLLLDAIVNLALGVLLVLSWPYGEPIARLLGVPLVEAPLYTSLLGAVLIGIAIALSLEWLRALYRAPVGLGLSGAAAINLCAALLLTAWLVFGRPEMPLRGWIVLGVLDVGLLALSALELIAHRPGTS
jgi:hypothetical protein